MRTSGDAGANIHEVCERVRSVLILAEFPKGLTVRAGTTTQLYPRSAGRPRAVDSGTCSTSRTQCGRLALAQRRGSGDAHRLRTRVARQVTIGTHRRCDWHWNCMSSTTDLAYATRSATGLLLPAGVRTGGRFGLGPDAGADLRATALRGIIEVRQPAGPDRLQNLASLGAERAAPLVGDPGGPSGHEG
jgi:hypothetical protein